VGAEEEERTRVTSPALSRARRVVRGGERRALMRPLMIDKGNFRGGWESRAARRRPAASVLYFRIRSFKGGGRMNRMIRSGASVESSISCFGHLARWYAVALRAFLTEIDFVLLKRPPTLGGVFFFISCCSL